jgi:hypothetical protein
MPALRNWIPVVPELAQAALKSGEETAFVAWSVLRAWDTDTQSGRGLIQKSEGRRLVEIALGVEPRQSGRILAGGDGRFWTLAGKAVFLLSAERVARQFGITGVSCSRVISIAQFTGKGSRRASLIATCYPMHDSGKPMTRRLVNELTGVSASTQRRLERDFGRVREVSKVVAFVGRQPTSWVATQWAHELRHVGFFSNGRGGLYRRHGSIRQAVGQREGRPSPKRRLNAALRTPHRPAIDARGQRNVRTYFWGDDAALRWSKARKARGKRAFPQRSIHPLLDYSLALRRAADGRLVTHALKD